MLLQRDGYLSLLNERKAGRVAVAQPLLQARTVFRTELWHTPTWRAAFVPEKALDPFTGTALPFLCLGHRDLSWVFLGRIWWGSWR